MKLQRFDRREHKYKEWEVPDEWKVRTKCEDLDEKINCAQCGKEIKFGDSYTSLEVHTWVGIGYSVCEKCYNKEWIRRGKDE